MVRGLSEPRTWDGARGAPVTLPSLHNGIFLVNRTTIQQNSSTAARGHAAIDDVEELVPLHGKVSKVYSSHLIPLSQAFLGQRMYLFIGPFIDFFFATDNLLASG
jgi:hypothetical protein